MKSRRGNTIQRDATAILGRDSSSLCSSRLCGLIGGSNCLPLHIVILLTIVALCPPAPAAEIPAAADFRKEVRPILETYCSDCHADGAKKGGVAFDEFKSDEALLANHDLWLRVLKNVRAGLMPPQKKPHPSAEEQKRLAEWIKFEAFGIDRESPDPGRVTVRRLNRIEYHNTIRDLMGIEFNTETEFPPDDTGYGFDNIGDVLTVSPMLLEKYMGAANTIVADAVPLAAKVMPERTIAGNTFRGITERKQKGEKNRKETFLPLSYYESAAVSNRFKVEHSGSYRVTLELAAKGNFEFDPGTNRVVFKIDDRELLQKETGWYDFKTFRFDFDENWKAGDHEFSLSLEPLTSVDKKINSLEMRIVSVVIHGPKEKEFLVAPKNYARFFPRAVPSGAAARRKYAGEVLRQFVTKAYRRPADSQTVDKLVGIAEKVYGQPDKSFEFGIGQAMVAVLSSPRFLFRLEEAESASRGIGVSANITDTPILRHSGSAFSHIDEYSLASRLSYFLWSTMPDDELFRLAQRGELRKNLAAQVKRMLADKRSQALVENFTGQWLQTRDVDGIDINAQAVLARDAGEQREMAARRERFRQLISIPAELRTKAENEELQQMFQRRRGRNNKPQVELDRDLRRAMREETQESFGFIVRENRSVLDLLDSDYTFLNEKLAHHYGLTNLDVAGNEMRRVTLPADSARGGVLTHGSFLVVTSNPDRTSPVKRGLFVLDNILGTPAPPPPANVPALEVADKEFKDHEPTLREALTLHREKPLCAGCHERMDPIGLAFENFNALGMWRDKERKQSIETGGKLITGESFDSIRELKRILVTNHRLDYYRCLTEKLLTYAIGRGLEYYDAETVDQIVARLDKAEGHFSELLMGIIDSSPFQKMRRQATETASN